MRAINVGFVVASLAAASLSAGLSSEPAPQKSPERYETVATAESNRLAEEAAKKGEAWPQNPLLVALKFVGEDGECSCRTIVIRRPEGRDTATVAITDEGLWDDSIRGEKYKLRLARTPSGTWKITEALKAWACRRGHADFSTEPCI